MPINAFGGGPGTGKTYGVIEHVILPAIAKGRFVITNIDGLNAEAIYEYVAREFYKGKIICIGHIRTCSRAAPESDEFFPGEESLDKAMPVPQPKTPNVVGGDLVVVDEATRYWPMGEKVTKRHAYFFREHRHFANEMGHTCDLVVIDPDLTMLARALKGKIEMSSLTHKPKELGLERYVVRLYRGVKFTGKPVSTSGPHPFKKEVYSLYRSYAVAGAKEQSIDDRQSLVRKLVAKLGGMALLAALCIGGVIFLVRNKVEKLEQEGAAAHPAAAAAAGAGGAAPASAGGMPMPYAGGGVSQTLRVAGEVVIRGERWVLLSDGSRLRLENPGAFVGVGIMMVGDVRGERITTWSGPSDSAEKPGLLGGN